MPPVDPYERGRQFRRFLAVYNNSMDNHGFTYQDVRFMNLCPLENAKDGEVGFDTKWVSNRASLGQTRRHWRAKMSELHPEASILTAEINNGEAQPGEAQPGEAHPVFEVPCENILSFGQDVSPKPMPGAFVEVQSESELDPGTKSPPAAENDDAERNMAKTAKSKSLVVYPELPASSPLRPSPLNLTRSTQANAQKTLNRLEVLASRCEHSVQDQGEPKDDPVQDSKMKPGPTEEEIDELETILYAFYLAERRGELPDTPAASSTFPNTQTSGSASPVMTGKEMKEARPSFTGVLSTSGNKNNNELKGVSWHDELQKMGLSEGTDGNEDE